MSPVLCYWIDDSILHSLSESGRFKFLIKMLRQNHP